MSVEARLEKAGLTLPPTPKPVGAYHPAIRAANLIYTSGQLPLAEGGLLAEGKVPTVVAVESAKLCARQAALNALAALQTQIESLDDIIRIVRVTVYVNSAQGFTGQAEVANGASELMITAFGREGEHCRCAIGAAELPLNSPVEVDLVAAVDY